MLDIFNLQGKVALFTGASRGLGKAMAVGLAQAGADVAVVGRHHDQDVLDQITAAGQRARFYEFDLANIDGIAALVAQVKADFGIPKIKIIIFSSFF